MWVIIAELYDNSEEGGGQFHGFRTYGPFANTDECRAAEPAIYAEARRTGYREEAHEIGLHYAELNPPPEAEALAA